MEPSRSSLQQKMSPNSSGGANNSGPAISNTSKPTSNVEIKKQPSQPKVPETQDVSVINLDKSGSGPGAKTNSKENQPTPPAAGSEGASNPLVPQSNNNQIGSAEAQRSNDPYGQGQASPEVSAVPNQNVRASLNQDPNRPQSISQPSNRPNETYPPRASQQQQFQPGNNAAYGGMQPPWCAPPPYTIQCQPIPANLFCCSTIPAGNSRPPQNMDPSGGRTNPPGDPYSTGMRDITRMSNPNANQLQVAQPNQPNEYFNMQPTDPAEQGNNWMPNSTGNDLAQYSGQNVPPQNKQLPPQFMMQLQCPPFGSNPVNMVWQGISPMDCPMQFADQGMSKCPMGMDMSGMGWQNFMQQQAQSSQCGKGYGQMGMMPFNNMANSQPGASPNPGGSGQGQMDFGPRNSMPPCPQLDCPPPPCCPCVPTNCCGCINPCCNGFSMENIPKCVTFPPCSQPQEQECQKPRQVTLVREVYHFKKLPRKCSTKQCCPAPSSTCCRPPWCQSYKSSRCNQGLVAVAPFKNDPCSAGGPQPRTESPSCKYSSCFCPWKSNHKLCCGSQGKVICVKAKRRGDCFCVEKPRGCVGPTSLVREFYVRGNQSVRCSRRFSRDDENNGPPDVSPILPPENEVTENFIANPVDYLNGSPKRLSGTQGRMSNSNRNEPRLDPYQENNQEQNEENAAPSVPFTKKP